MDSAQMPRNGSGVYSLPSGYEATTGQTAEASQHNSPLEDIKNDLNAARPVVAGGTGATTAAGALSNLGLTVTAAKLNSLAQLPNRNLIINGNFGINQRGVSGTVTLSAGAYGHDCWKAGSAGCTYTFATSENVTTITISAGSLVQVIEGLNLQSGTHVLSWTGTVQMTIDGGSAGNSGMTGTLTGGTNATVETSGTGTLSLVQLEPGNTDTPFEHRSYGQELELCQRYYQTGIARLRAALLAGVVEVTNQLPVTMRATPTMTGAGISALSPNTILISDVSTGSTGNVAYTASAEL